MGTVYVTVAGRRSFDGTGEIDGKIWNLAGQSRLDRAAIIDEARWQTFERREADQLGLG